MTTERTQKSIFLFWLPLAATWLMMSVEGPFLAAVIARLADPRFNLAAHGVAFAFALLIEAPVIMIMSASTALAEDRLSFKRLRNFIYSLNGVVTAAQLLILIPAVFRFIMLDLVAIPEEVADLSYWALWILLPWPGAIGYRRFFQGILIRAGRTRLVAFGTVVRLTTMASTGLVLFFFLRPPGAWVGAASLSMGVMAEALASRLMARGSVRRLLETPEPEGKGALAEDGAPYEELTYGRIISFYYPLALTSMIALAAQPMMTFFMGRAAAPVESLAVFPVVTFTHLHLSFRWFVLPGSGNRPHGSATRACPVSGPVRSGPGRGGDRHLRAGGPHPVGRLLVRVRLRLEPRSGPICPSAGRHHGSTALPRGAPLLSTGYSGGSPDDTAHHHRDSAGGSRNCARFSLPRVEDGDVRGDRSGDLHPPWQDRRKYLPGGSL